MRDDVEQIIRHDLVTPLSGLIGIPELLETEANLTPQQRELLRHAATSGRRMLATIRLAGDLARMEKGTYNVAKGDCDVLGIIREARLNLEALFTSKRLALAVLLDGRPAKAEDRVPSRGNANLLGNLFENLLKNAAEASFKLSLYSGAPSTTALSHSSLESSTRSGLRSRRVLLSSDNSS